MRQVCRNWGCIREKKRKKEIRLDRKGKREKKEEINFVGRRGKKLGGGKETSSVSHMTNL